MLLFLGLNIFLSFFVTLFSTFCNNLLSFLLHYSQFINPPPERKRHFLNQSIIILWNKIKLFCWVCQKIYYKSRFPVGFCFSKVCKRLLSRNYGLLHLLVNVEKITNNPIWLLLSYVNFDANTVKFWPNILDYIRSNFCPFRSESFSAIFAEFKKSFGQITQFGYFWVTRQSVKTRQFWCKYVYSVEKLNFSADGQNSSWH